MSTTGHYSEYDEFLRMMTEAQRYKLRLNAKKGFLGDVPPAVLLGLLRKEVDELEEAAERGSKIEMILEAADVANFALGFIISALQTVQPIKPVEPLAALHNPSAKLERTVNV